MPKFIDLSNKEINGIKILYRTTMPGVPIKWKCLCQCGQEFEARGNDIKTGKIKSCGCLRKKMMAEKQLINEQGNKYGRLTVISLNPNNTWHCLCECGNECDVTGSHLRTGNTQSCGCLHKETFKNKENLIGQKFGKLLVLEETEERVNKNIVWKCQCDCGNICKVYTSMLTLNKTKSCGCLKSQGEEKIALILKQNNIPFEQQKTFPTCRFPNTNTLAKFDFYVDNKYIIEYDGKQHFGLGGWEEDFSKLQYRDNYKTQWCKENNIPLIRIPYTELENITLEKILI